MTTVTVLPGPERRRRWTTAQKLEIVQETFASGATVSEVARRHDVHLNLVYLWRRHALNGALSAEPDGDAKFAPVAVVNSQSSPTGMNGCTAGVIELVLRNGRILRVPDGVLPVRVLQLAEALEGNGR
jgi:transposase